MGFGFNFFFVLVLIPLTGILLIAWLISRKPWILKTLGILWLGIIGLVLFSRTWRLLNSNIELDKEDYYGEYVIKRDFFKGEQTNWQYNHFRFKITAHDSIFFYVTEEEKILHTYTGKIKTKTPYSSARLIIEMVDPSHHILSSNPTTYRTVWDFYLVFNSPKFHNVYFEKGKWKPIE